MPATGDIGRAGANAGFCDAGTTPWMRVVDDYKTVNAEAQQKERKDGEGLSPLQFWQRGLANRKKHKDVFVYGSYQLLNDDESPIFAYKRSSKTDAFVVVLNFSGKEQEYAIPADVEVTKWVTTTYNSGPGQAVKGSITLKPWEGLLGIAKV